MTRSSRTSTRRSRSGAGGLPEEADVLIVGCGPAGLVLAAQMANFPDIRTVVIDRKDGPLEVGQADGVACRTVEMFEAFGLAIVWSTRRTGSTRSASGGRTREDRTKITRTGRIQDTEEGLSEFPHVIVNQARLLAYLLDHMERSPSRLQPFYGLHASDVEVDTSGVVGVPRDGHRCAHAEGPARRPGRPRRSGPSTSSGATARAAHIRTAIGRELVGDPMNESWGVMDVLARHRLSRHTAQVRDPLRATRATS